MGGNLDDWIGEGEAKEKQQLLAVAAETLARRMEASSQDQRFIESLITLD
jgi:hypothetical protein